MRQRRLLAGLGLVLSALLMAGTASAANILRFLPVEETVSHGETLSMQLQMEFTDTMIGGGIVLAFDPTLLGAPTITFSDSLGDDPSLRCPDDTNICPPIDLFISWGNFAGITGTKLVVTLDFPTLDEGVTTVGGNIPIPQGQFADLDGNELLVEIIPATVTVVPEPSTGLMLALGLGGLAGVGRRRSV